MPLVFNILVAIYLGVLTLTPVSLRASDFSLFEDDGFEEAQNQNIGLNLGDEIKNSGNSFVQGIKDKFSDKEKKENVEDDEEYDKNSTDYLINKLKKRKQINFNDIESWMISGNDVNGCLDGGNTFVTYYARYGNDRQIMEFLMGKGARLQTSCIPSKSVLFEAVRFNANLEITDVLINADANIMLRDNDGNSILIMAAMNNTNPQIIDVLADYGISINDKNKYGYTALMMAIANNSMLMIKKLVDNGVDINARDLDGRTALMVSAIRGNDDIIQYLIKNGADYKVVDKDGLNVLDYYHKRVYLNDEGFKYNKYASIAEQLHQKFNYISESHKKYNNLLKNSIKNSADEQVVIDAIKKHADIDVKDENMCTPLLNAAQNNLGANIFRDLLVSGANPNASCLGGKTPLMFLAANSNEIDVYDQIKKISLLYEYKVEPNVLDDDGNNALMYAVDFNANSGVIKGLLDIGVNPNVINKKGESIIGNAVKKGIDARALEVLIEGGADLNVKEGGVPLIWYVLENDVRDDIVITLANGGIDLGETNKNNDSPLWYAMYNDVSLPIILALIENEKEIDNINKNEDTYLLYAIKNDFPASVIKALLSAGANPYIVDKNGNNAIDIIKKSQYFEETMKRKTKEYVLDDWEF